MSDRLRDDPVRPRGPGRWWGKCWVAGGGIGHGWRSGDAGAAGKEILVDYK